MVSTEYHTAALTLAVGKHPLPKTWHSLLDFATCGGEFRRGDGCGELKRMKENGFKSLYRILGEKR